MATHTYSRSSGGLTVSGGTQHVFVTEAFSVPAGERLVRMQVIDPNTSQTNIRMESPAADVFHGFAKWATAANITSNVWSNGGGVSVKVTNPYGMGKVSMRITVTIETEDLPSYTVTCRTSGSGTLTANKSTAYQGQTVTLTPKPATGYKFSKYTSSPSVTISSNKFTMPASNVTVTATFTNQSYTVTVVSANPTMGTVTGGGSKAYGSSVTIKATPSPGYRFVNWTKTAGTLANANAATTTFTVPASAATVTAHFELSQSIVGRYDGTSFEDCLVSYYDGTAWQDCDVYRYNGSSFEKISKA